MTSSVRQWVRAFAPATVSNVTCGFDLLGFAIEGRGDRVEARTSDEPGVRILEISGDDGRLPTDPARNTAGVTALELLARTAGDGDARGLDLRLHKGLPIASGLGSSAASAVATAVAANAALALGADRETLLTAALEGERLACGAPHSDNVAPSLLGGMVLCRAGTPPVLTRITVPSRLTCVVVHPHAEVTTGEARAILPQSVALDDVIVQAGNLAALVTGMLRQDYDLIASAMVDRVAEPVRAEMTPGFRAVRVAALEAGALGCGLSGSGPTMFAFTRGRSRAAEIETAMLEAFDSAGLGADSLISKVGAPGARLLADSDDGELA